MLLPVAAERDLLSILAGRQSSIDRYPSTVTDPTGWFCLQGLQAGRYRIGPVRLPEGLYRLSIDYPRYAARTLDVQVGGPDREITVPLDPV